MGRLCCSRVRVPQLLATALLLCPPATLSAESRVGFVTADGVSLVGTYYEPAHGPAPMVLLLHMPTRSRADWAVVGPRFAERGIGALAIDLRGHGESGADPFHDPSGEARLRDVEAGLAWLNKRSEAIPGRVGLVGASLGANLAAVAASVDPNIQALVLLSVTLDFRGLRTVAALQAFGARPALLVVSREDSYAARSARELAADAPGVREVWWLDGAGHGAVMLTRQPELVATLVDWLSARLL